MAETEETPPKIKVAEIYFMHYPEGSQGFAIVPPENMWFGEYGIEYEDPSGRYLIPWHNIKVVKYHLVEVENG